MRIRSSAAWLAASCPCTADAISPFTFWTALLTPLPSQSLPPSLSSVASNSPVEAPDGTAALPHAPDLTLSSTSTVGLPRLSRIWRACTCSIWLIGLLAFGQPRPRVVGELVVGGEIVPAMSLGCGELLARQHARLEPIGRCTQRQFRIDGQLARH